MVDADVVVLGAGGAGLFCAWTAARRGRKVLVLDHSRRPGGKLLVSGGGRCNFTNRDVSARNYVSENPHFCKSALSRFTPEAFVALVDAHRVAWHERRHGQLFCTRSAKDLLALLLDEVHTAGAELRLGVSIERVEGSGGGFVVHTSAGPVRAAAVVVATGSLSFPKLGATGIGHDIARSFGLPIVPCAPALDGLVFSEADRARFEGLAGNHLDAALTTGGIPFRENLLFTHVGLSGPVALQASLYWRPGATVWVDWLPDQDPAALRAWLVAQKSAPGALKNQLGTRMPKRLAERLCAAELPEVDKGNLSNRALDHFAARLKAWPIEPVRTVGYDKAEVTRGGVDTAALSSKTMEARAVPGLYFIGEVVDVTGWLGGFNYQWAWASGKAAGEAV